MTRHFIVMLLLLFIAGCATSHKEIDTNPPVSSHHFRDDYLDVTWQAVRNNDDIIIKGTVSNAHSLYLQNLELTARLMSEQGKIIGRGTYVDFPDSLAPSRTALFHLEYHLPPGAQVKSVNFIYVCWVVTEREGAPPLGIFLDSPRAGAFSSPL